MEITEDITVTCLIVLFVMFSINWFLIFCQLPELSLKSFPLFFLKVCWCTLCPSGALTDRLVDLTDHATNWIKEWYNHQISYFQFHIYSFCIDSYFNLFQPYFLLILKLKCYSKLEVFGIVIAAMLSLQYSAFMIASMPILILEKFNT